MALTSLASPALSAAPATEAFQALLRTAAFAPIHDRGFLRITGEDRVRWLNGMVTNSVQDLAPGAGAYNFLLNAQGHIQGIADIFAMDDSLMLESDSAQLAPIQTLLDKFIIMDDVELSDVSAGLSGLLLAGPAAPRVLESLALLPDTRPTPSIRTQPWRNAPLRLIHAWSPVVPRFELWAEPTIIAALRQAFVTASLTEATSEHLEWLRALEGTPRFGIDIRGRELPQETAPDATPSRALHFSKGCYLGQEIVERIRSRGRLHRTFSAFTLETPPSLAQPRAGTALSVGGHPVGELTTVITVPPCLPFPTGLSLGLGYVRRDAIEQHHTLTCDTSTATPAPLPFPISS